MRIYGYELIKLRKRSTLWITAVLLVLGCLVLCFITQPGERLPAQTQEEEDYAHYEMVDGVPVLVIQDSEQQIQDWEAYRESYGVFINEMADRVDKMSSTSLFGNQNGFAYRNLQKTQLDYASFAGTELRYGAESGVRAYNDYTSGILFTLAFLALLMYYVLYDERGQNLLLLLKGTKRGHGALAAAKLGAMLSGATLYVLVQELTVLGYFAVAHGFGDLSRTAQSVSLFRNCVLHITLGQALALTVLARIGVAWVLAAFLYLVGTVVRSEAAAVVCAGGILAGEFFLSVAINPGSSLCALKFLNPFYSWKMSCALAEYQNINVLGFPVGKGAAMLVLGAACIAAFAGAGMASFSLRYQVKTASRFSGLLLWIRQHTAGLFHTVSLLWFEAYKLLIGQKKILVLVLLAAWGYNEFTAVSGVWSFAAPADAAYQYYMNQIGGPITDESMAWLEGEQQRIADLRRQLQDAQEAGASNGEMLYLSYTIGNEITLYEEGLQRVVNQVDWLKTLPGGLSGKYLVNEPALTNLWFDTQTDTRLWLIGGLIAVFLLSGIRTGDEKRRMTTLLASTQNGREKLDRNRHRLALLLTLAVFAVSQLRILVLYGRDGAFGVLGQKLCWFSTGVFQAGIPIGVLMLAVFLLKGLSFLAVCLGTETLTRTTKNATVTLLLGGGIVIAVYMVALAFHTDITAAILGLLY